MTIDENAEQMATIECSKCKKSIELPILQISNSSTIACPHCGIALQLSDYNPEAEKWFSKNQKELNKLKKLLE